MSKIVHIGFGAFHKSHQAAYLQELSDSGFEHWSIHAVNLRPSDSEQFAIEATKSHYMLRTFDEAGTENTKNIDRHDYFSDWASNPNEAEAVLTDPQVTNVTITISEAGYYFDKKGKLDNKHSEIVAEKARKNRSTIYAYLLAAISSRIEANCGPLNILCCDNLRDNGTLLERNFIAYLNKMERPDLASWVTENCAFPCSMVDRITPAPTLSAKANSAAGTEVIAETFVQWVLEDNFVAARPSFEKVGVQLVECVTQYEEAKIRVLNGGHTAITYLGALSGYMTFDEAMEDPELRDHFLRFERVEVSRAMPKDIPIDLTAYIKLIEQRFVNKAIGDSITRICNDGYAKFSIFVRPTLEGCFAAGQVPAFTIRSIAAWFHYACGIKEGRADWTYNEPNWDRLKPKLDRANTIEFLSCPALFGDVAKKHPEFVSEFERQLIYVEQKWPI